MASVVFYITYPFIWLFSKLPFKILYGISDVLFLLLYYGIGYRKKVVLDNLTLAFPEKSEKELKDIRKKFFRYFVDFFIESLKTITISEKEIKARYRYTNIEVIDELYRKDKSVVLMMAHYGNWEWIINLPLYSNIASNAAYTKVNNKHFEKVVKEYRSKFGMTLVKSSEVIKRIVENTKQKKQGLYVLASDQSPEFGKAQYWRTFFNRMVPVHTGGDMIARKFDFAVVNANVTRVKRGYYEIELELIAETVKDTPRNTVIDLYTEMIEKHIAKQPEFYLWSHKRFKHLHRYEEWLSYQKKS